MANLLSVRHMEITGKLWVFILAFYFIWAWVFYCWLLSLTGSQTVRSWGFLCPFPILSKVCWCYRCMLPHLTFDMGSGYPNSILKTWMASTLFTEPSSQLPAPLFIYPLPHYSEQPGQGHLDFDKYLLRGTPVPVSPVHISWHVSDPSLGTGTDSVMTCRHGTHDLANEGRLGSPRCLVKHMCLEVISTETKS